MQNSDVRKTIPEPLMFIHTVSTPIITNGSRRYFDSRDKNIKTVVNKDNLSKPIQIIKKKSIDEILLNKINNIIQMYKMSNPVLCIVETTNNESIEGIPYQIDNEILSVKTNEDIIEINLYEINDVIILKV